jgi:hypothetical protein
LKILLILIDTEKTRAKSSKNLKFLELHTYNLEFLDTTSQFMTFFIVALYI